MAVLGKGVYYDPQKDAYRVVLEGVVKTFNPRTLGVTKAEALRQANEFAKNYIKNNPDLYTPDGKPIPKERKITKANAPKRFDKRFQNWYENQYLPEDSVYNKFKTGGSQTKGTKITKAFKDLDGQEIANLYRTYETNKKYIPVYERIKKLDLVTGEELGKIVGVENMRVKAKELMYPPKKYKRQKNIFGNFFKNELKAEYIDIGQGGKTAGTLFYKRPNEEQILKMQEYFNRGGAKYGITTPVQNRVKLLHNNPQLRSYVRKGKIVPEEILTKYMTLQQGAHATLRLAQIYNGHKFPNVDLGIPENKEAGRAFFKAFEKFPFQNPYRVAVYKAAMETITQDLGSNYFNKFNLDNLKREAGRILNREGIPLYHSKSKNPYGVNINEITGITASARTGTAPYSQFINIMEGRLNQVDYARFLKTFEKKQNELAAELAKTGGNPNKIIREYDSYTKTFLKQIKDPATRDLMKGLEFPRLTLKTPEQVYGADRIKQLQDIGLDLPKAYEDMKYTIQVPKGTATLKEFVDSPSKFLPDIKKKLKGIVKQAPVSCQLVMAQATGGRVPADCLNAIDQDPIGSAQKIASVEATSGPLLKAKNAVLGFLRSGGFKTFGAGAAVGTAVGLVKLFKNDDPTTYLSNEDQQKNMLVDMVTQPISTDMTKPDILDFQLPAVGASLAASTALGAPSTIKASRSRGLGVEQKGLIRTGGRVLGRGLGIAASPGVLAPLAALDITRQVSEGDSLEDIATDPFNYTYPIFAEQTPRLTRGLPSAFRKFASLGLKKPALRLLSRAGLAGLGASLAIQGLGLTDD